MSFFRKICFFIILFSVFFNFNAYSEIVNKIDVQGNERISKETIVIFGDIALDTDRLVRTLGFNRLAKQDYEAASDEVKEYLNCYSNGVNAFFILPHEFKKSIFSYSGLSFKYTSVFIKKYRLQGQILENEFLKVHKKNLINAYEIIDN